jgi:hypothetical protein
VENLVLNYILPIIGSIVSFLMILLARKVLMWMEVKMGIATSDKFEKDMENFVKDAVYAAEEKACSSLKNGLPKWTSDMKLGWVLNIVGNRFPTLSKEDAETKVNAMLGKTLGLGTTKAVGEQCVESKQITTVPIAVPLSSCNLVLDPIIERELAKP